MRAPSGPRAGRRPGDRLFACLAVILLASALAACGSRKPKPPPPPVDILVIAPSVGSTDKRAAEVVGRLVIENRSGKADRLLRATTDVAQKVEILETVPPPPPSGPGRIVPENVPTAIDPGPGGAEARRNALLRRGPGDRFEEPRDGGGAGTGAASGSGGGAGGGTAGGSASGSGGSAGGSASGGSGGGASASASGGSGGGSSPPRRREPIPLRHAPNPVFREFVRAEAPTAAEEAQKRAAAERRSIVRVTNQGVPLGAGARVVFQPGGYQLRFVRVPRPLRPGTSFPVRLHFEHAGTIVAPFIVRTAADERAPFPPPSRANPYTPADRTPPDTGPPPALVVPTRRN